MSTPSAYQLEQAMAVLLATRQRLLAEDPDIASDERLFSDMLEGEAGDAMSALDGVLRAAVQADSMATAAEARITDMEMRRDRYRNRANTLRGAAFAAMDALGLRKRELPDLTAGIRSGHAKVIITDETAIPDHLMRVTRTPNKDAIGSAIRGGATVPGAEIANGTPTLQLRTR